MEQLIEKPRFSNLLRLSHPSGIGEWDGPINLAALRAARSLQPPPPSEESNESDDAPLTFNKFISNPKNEKPTTELKNTFKSFMALAEEMVGSSNTTSLLFGIGDAPTPKELTAFREEVERGFGAVNSSQWAKAVPMARLLAEWHFKVNHEALPEGTSSQTRIQAQAQAATRRALAFEYGHDEEFNDIFSQDPPNPMMSSVSFGNGAGAEQMEPPSSDGSKQLYDICVNLSTSLSTIEVARGILSAVKIIDVAACQESLFQLLGEDAFEAMIEVMESKEKFASLNIDQVMKHGEQAQTSQMLFPPASKLYDIPPPLPVVTVPMSSQFTVRSATDIAHEKKYRKERSKALKQAHQMEEQQVDGQGKDWLRTLGFNDAYLEQERALGLQKGQEFETGKPQITVKDLLGAGSREYHGTDALPSGTTRQFINGAEEVVVPPPRRLPTPDHGELVAVATALPDWAQGAFNGISHLNRIQSAIFPTAFHSAENMLVCAPTGAGKTNCAVLALLQQAALHIDEHDGFDRSNFKCVYIAPMKALAQEVVASMSQRLGYLGCVVKELTGDMQLTRAEVDDANLIVTTPEKWDVVTRKGGTDGSLATKCKLLIIDEVHLLADERGAVIESVVARTQRLVESAQTTVRILALSATLPNYKDVALFLRVNPNRGLFFFGPEFRPVPLKQTFIGITEKNRMKCAAKLNEHAFEICLDAIRRGHQVMVFVHARKDTVRTAQAIRELAVKEGVSDEFLCGKPGDEFQENFEKWDKQICKSRNAELRELFAGGFAMHHAGMLRSDRSMVEKLFKEHAAKVLICTATLAWGVNLPAHSVVIKGTEVYDPSKGGHVDLSMLDVNQIFGRAGRPQFDRSGEATMLTTHEALPRYLRMLGHQSPIESNFGAALCDHLNAEVSSGTVTSINEAVAWLSYTYFYIRMVKNPLAYGLKYDERDTDPELHVARYDKATAAAKQLDELRMIRFDPRSGNLAATDIGRTASHFYIQHNTISVFNDMIEPHMTDDAALHVLCRAAEFEQLKVRPEELSELEKLKRKVPLHVTGPIEESAAKVSILLQSYISRDRPLNFTLISDTNYVAQNGARVCRALFEITLRKGLCTLSTIFLRLARCIDRRVWWWESPLRQVADALHFPEPVIRNLESKKATIDVLSDMTAQEVGSMIHHERLGGKVLSAVRSLPRLLVNVQAQPVTNQILRITIHINCGFTWAHSTTESFWIWIGDSENDHIYHSEMLLLNKKQRKEEQILAFTIPIAEPLPSQYFVHVMNDRWVGLDEVHAVSFKHLILPNQHPPHSNLLDLVPLPLSALQNEAFEKLYRDKMTHFNPIQTQVFHSLFHTDGNVLLGAPTSSGKTIVAELAILRMLRPRFEGDHTKKKAVYIAPLKALARERLKDWRVKFGEKLGLMVVELTGDVTPDSNVLSRADIIITTPEKWDGVTRSWRKRSFVREVAVVIIDEIHLLGEDRGPVLEVIVSRMRYITAKTKNLCRLIGLSTALANAHDLADWLGIDPRPGKGLFNFRPAVRPVPMEVHMRGFPGQHYCPRMATMNKPTYSAIMEHSPHNPVLVFVASRRQTRLTALDIISYCAAADNPRQFLNMQEEEVEDVALTIKDEALRHTLLFGVGLHHAGLSDHDRNTVEELFVSQKIMVLVCTSTLAWGVNFPARLVVVKGTEFFDAKLCRYVDFPVTDILQMMGRAGRPQFDDKGIACVFVHAPKKNFYKKFLYEPFPLESNLKEVLHNHINAEIGGGTITNKLDAVEYLTWTFFFRRLLVNPSYYGCEGSTTQDIQKFLLSLVDACVDDLERAGCVVVSKDFDLAPTTAGIIASYYYLDYRSVGLMRQGFSPAKGSDIEAVCRVLCSVYEFAELPVRHNEEDLNGQLASTLSWRVDPSQLGDPHTKTFLLLQAHFERKPLPISDYVNDTKSVLDQSLRVLNAMVDLSAECGSWNHTLSSMHLCQSVVMAYLPTSNSPEIAQLPISKSNVSKLIERGLPPLLEGLLKSLRSSDSTKTRSLMNAVLGKENTEKVISASDALPLVSLSCSLVSQEMKNAFLPNSDVKVQVTAQLNFGKSRGGKNKLVTPYFHKPRELGWWVIIGDKSKGELLGLKKVSPGDKQIRTEIVFAAPVTCGVNQLEVMLVADSVCGLDAHTELALLVQSK